MTTLRFLTTLFAISSALLAGCSRPAEQPAAAAPGATATSAPVSTPAPGMMPEASPAPAPAAVSSHGDEAGTAATAAVTGPMVAGGSVTGTVAETMDAANYTYVRVKTKTGDIWAATGQFKVAVGDRVTVPLEMPMQNFHSQALKRDFPVVYFAGRITKEGEQAQAVQPAMPPGHPPTGGVVARPAATVTERIDPAPGGTTVADVWAKRASLAGKTITVRGKVVKFNAQIMGRNWMHLQDGTGKADDKNNDLTVTSAAEAKVGDVVTVTGKVAVDKDFGAGYAYPVLVEDAVVVLK